MVNKGKPLFVNKEDENFREALKLYDKEQFKRALRLVEANLKKNSSHAESLALKGCISFHLGNKTDAASYIERAIAKDPSNYLVDHLSGIYYRAIENYTEAAKWMKAATDNGSPNKQILRDTALLQCQIRDYKGLLESRQAFLENQPGYRANWTGLAVAFYLNKEYKGAITTLTKIEEIIKDHITDADKYEHSECVLFKITILGEAGDPAKALESLRNDLEVIFDETSSLELEAKYLVQLDRKKEASLIYRKLLKTNPDNVDYYKLLEETLGTNKANSATRLKLYEKLEGFYPRSDPPQFLPLTFLKVSDPKFREKALKYIIDQLKRGVPSAFVNVKPLYKFPEKINVIESIVINFLENEVPHLTPQTNVWTNYFLSQHYLNLKQYEKADEYIDTALSHSPTLVELYIVKARVLKHQGKPKEAAEFMNEGRMLDLQDRFINSKAAKYYLRSDNIDKGVDTISLFTKLDDDAVNGCKDLQLMQVTWFLIESAEAYTRIYKTLLTELEELESSSDNDKAAQEAELLDEIETYKGLALKRYHSIVRIFDIFFNDQFDFHSYCLRRGTARHYIETIEYEDLVRTTPIYLRVIKGLYGIYYEIYGQQNQSEIEPDQTIVKKASALLGLNSKKAKKTKSGSLKKRAELIKKVESEKEDPDPLGAALLSDLVNNENGNIIDRLSDLLKPVSDSGKDLLLPLEINFQIHLIKGKYVLALQAIKNLNKLLNPKDKRKLKVIGDMVDELATSIEKDKEANAAISKVVEKSLDTSFPEYNKFPLDKFHELYSEV